MQVTSIASIIRKASRLIEKEENWTQCDYAKTAVSHEKTHVMNEKASCFCSLGAIIRAACELGVITEYRRPHHDMVVELQPVLDRFVSICRGLGVVYFKFNAGDPALELIFNYNDNRTFRSVRELWDAVVAQLDLEETPVPKYADA